MARAIRCKNCVYWRQLANPIEKDRGHCKLTEYEGGPSTEKPLAIALDGEGYYAILDTHKNFGCIQGRQK